MKFFPKHNFKQIQAFTISLLTQKKKDKLIYLLTRFSNLCKWKNKKKKHWKLTNGKRIQRIVDIWREFARLLTIKVVLISEALKSN